MCWTNPFRGLPACGLILVAGSLTGCAATGGTVPAPLEVIDAHVYTDFDGQVVAPSRVTSSKAELAAEMERYHVVAAVAVLQSGERPPDLSGIAVVRCASIGSDPSYDAVAAALSSRELHCLTISLGPGRREAGDPAYDLAYGLAESNHVPVVFFYDGDLRAFTDPGRAEPVIRDHPDVTFVLSHRGNPNSADERDRDSWLQRHQAAYVPFGHDDDPWIGFAAWIAGRYPNVVIDGSALLVGDLRNARREQVEAYVERPLRGLIRYLHGPGKLMFGSAWPLVEIGQYLEAFEQAIPSDSWRAVFRDNAARVFGLAPTLTPR
jgi:predicted TIM-barrel fold metal-dependent hydrolase